MNEESLSELIKRKLRPTKKFYLLLILGVILSVFSAFLPLFTKNYRQSLDLAPAYDFILAHLPVIDGVFMQIYVYAFALFLFVFFSLVTVRWPKLLPYCLIMFAFSQFLRALFFNVTVLHEPLGALNSNLQIDVFRDLFYSNHVGLPFLATLIIPLRKYKLIFYIFLALIIISILFTHCHYTIDILGGIVINYATFVFFEKHFRECLTAGLFKSNISY